MIEPWHARAIAAERRIGRLLIGITYLSVALLAVGVVLLLASGTSPMAGGPAFDVTAIGAHLARLEPAGYLWLGLLAIIAAPVARVFVAGFVFLRDGDRAMAGIALAILAVLAFGIVIAGTGTV
jgi:uncharacterized membrane protein